MRVGTTEVNSKQEYLAGLRDEHRIEMLKLRGDLTDPKVASAMYRRLKSQPFYFETEVGKKFVRELGAALRPSERSIGTDLIRKNHQEEEGVKQPGQTGNIQTIPNRQHETRRKTASTTDINVRKIQPDTSLVRLNNTNEQTWEHATGRTNERKTEGKEETGRSESRDSGKRTLRHWLAGLGVMSALILAYCITSEVSYRVESHQSAKKMSELQGSVLRPLVTVTDESAQILDRIAMTDSGTGTLHAVNDNTLPLSGNQTGKSTDSLKGIENEAVSERGPEVNSPPAILPEYKELYLRNQDMVGWIEIPGTVVNYPVMQTKDDMEYYLQRDFDREEDLNGLPFLDARSDIIQPTTNQLIYGHCMKNGSMFETLLKYKEKSFWNEHPRIRFDTIYEKAEYEIIAVYQTKVANVEDEVFRYYDFINADTEQEMKEYIDIAKKNAYYETGKTAEFGDELLTLSTCDKEITDGRLVVVARKCTK